MAKATFLTGHSMKDLLTHLYRTSDNIVRVENASDNNNGPLIPNPCGDESGLKAKEVRNGE